MKNARNLWKSGWGHNVDSIKNSTNLEIHIPKNYFKRPLNRMTQLFWKNRDKNYFWLIDWIWLKSSWVYCRKSIVQLIRMREMKIDLKFIDWHHIYWFQSTEIVSVLIKKIVARSVCSWCISLDNVLNF